MKILLLIVLIGIAVAGLAAVVAIWVERDVKRPRKFAWALSVLILLATGVTILQAVLQDKQDKIDKAADEAEKQKLQGDVARMMQTLDKIAGESGDPRLQQFLSTEIEAQSRTNPGIVQKLAQRYADDGEDPAEKLAKHLPKSEVQKMARSGSIKTEPSAVRIERKREAPVVIPPPRPVARPVADTSAAGEEGTDDTAGETGAIEPTAAAAARGQVGAVRVPGVAGAKAGATTGVGGGPAIGGTRPPAGGAKTGHKKPATTDKR